MKTDPLTEFARELAQMGFSQDHLEMQLPRRKGEVSWLSIHRVGKGYRISISGVKRGRVGVSVKDLTLDSIKQILPQWLREKIDAESPPAPERRG